VHAKCPGAASGPAVLNDLLLKRLAIAHMATEVRGGIAIQTRLTITPAGLREIGGGATSWAA
jgi:hypothetical protein